MEKTFKRLLSWLVVIALVLPMIPAFTLPAFAAEEKASETVYGGDNVPAAVQEQIAQAAQLRANAASFITAGTCPLCGGEVDWVKAEGNISVKDGAAHHYYIEGDLALSSGWPIAISSTGTKLHIILKDANVTMPGPVWLGNASSKDVELAIMGNGTMTTNGSVTSNEANQKNKGMFWFRGTNSKLILNGGTYTNTYASQTNENALINALEATSAQIDIYDGTVIGPETMSTTVDAYNVTLVNTTMNMYGGKIRNGTRVVNTWASGANVSIKDGGTLNMYGGSIENSYSAQPGSSISLTTGTSKMNMYGGTIMGGKYADGTAKSGGNVYLAAGGAQFNMYGGTVTGGTATDMGGNIYSGYSSAPINISGGTVSGGKAPKGGNVAGWGAITISGNPLITGGEATTGVGGNVYQHGSSLAISGGKIENGKAASGNGGNISTNGRACTVTGGIITGGNALRGGNIHTTSGTITVSGGTVSNGTAAQTSSSPRQGGGNIYSESGTIEISGTAQITGGIGHTGGSICGGGTVNIKGGTVTGGKAVAYGGSIFGVTVNVSGGTVSNGVVTTADFSGGNIYSNGALTVTGGTISGGKAGYGSDGIPKGYGGNLATAGSISVTGGTVKEGKAFYGGNIASLGKPVTIGGTAQIMNGDTRGKASNLGGNIFVNGSAGSLTISGGTITGGNAENGGSIALYAPMTMSAGLIDGGNATIGGNIYVTSSAAKRLTVTGGTISNGIATYGANIALYAHAEISGDAKVIGSKTQTSSNIYMNGGHLTVGGNAEISGGNTAGSGGNVQMYSNCSLTMTGGTIKNGKAAKGGNIFSNKDTSTIDLLGGTISGGEVPVASALGGNLYVENGYIFMNGVNIQSGKAFAAANAYLLNCLTVMQNTAITETTDEEEVGHGSIYLAGSSVTAMIGGKIESDKQAIYLRDSGKLILVGDAQIVGGTRGVQTTKTSLLALDATWTGKADLRMESDTFAVGDPLITDLADSATARAIVITLKQDMLAQLTGAAALKTVTDITALYTEGGYLSDEATLYYDNDLCKRIVNVGGDYAGYGLLTKSVAHTAGTPVRENEKEGDCLKPETYESVIYCEDCGEELSRETQMGFPGGHELTYVEAKAATCEEDGHKAHYVCSVCGKTFETDDEFATEEFDIVVGALEHAYGEWTPVDAETHMGTCANNTEHTTTAPHSEAVEGKCPDCGYVMDPSIGAIAKVTIMGSATYCKTLDELLAGVGTIPAGVPVEVQLLDNIVLPATLEIPNGMDLTLDLNGKTLSGTDTTNTSYALIKNTGKLTVKDTAEGGKITLTATQDTGYNRYSTVISNNPGGELVVESGTIEHLGGHTMAYAIDNLTNGKGTSAVTTINGGLITSSYVGIRQFLNGTEATNELTVNGGTVTGGNCSIFFQSPSAKANSGKLVIAEEAQIGKRIYFGAEANSPELDIQVSIAEAALAEGVEIVLDSNMADYYVANENGIIGVNYIPELPTAKVEKIKNDDLTFALNFKAEDATAAQLDYYGDWYADFVLTVNKPITFNANGTADGWLSGQYDEFGPNWYNVPPSDVHLEAGGSINIMEYAAELLDEPGLRYTYKEVYDIVKDFDCGVFLSREYIMANPDLEITLELRMFKDKNDEEGVVIGETYVFTIPELPDANANKVENDELTFAMNFEVVAPTEEQLDFYGSWYADYVLTVNKPVTFNANGTADGWLSGQYDDFGPNWYNVPPSDVYLEAGESIQIMKYAADLLKEPGLRFTYQQIVEIVGTFDCGVFFDADFLAANPDLEVTLELRLFQNAEDEVGTKIGETYVFEAPIVAKIGDTEFKTLAAAVEAATNGDTIVVVADHAVASSVIVDKDVTIDLNGKTVSAASTMASQPVFRILGNVTVTGGTVDGTPGNSAYAFIVGNNETAGTLNIADGTYKGDVTVVSITKGVANISGGHFSVSDSEWGTTYLLNCIDDNVKNGTAKFVVTGGTYVGFNPKENAAENPAVNFCAPGYKGVDDGTGTYTVEKSEDIVAWNTVTGVEYEDVELAVYEAKSGETVQLLKDCAAEELWVRSGRTLDLNGYKLTVAGEFTAATSTAQIKDSSDGKGILAVAAQENAAFNAANAYLPIWVEGEGFHFVIHTFETRVRTNASGSSVQFRFWMDGAADCYAAQQLADGGADNGVYVKVKMTWTNSDGKLCEQYFTFPEGQVAEYATNADADNNWGTNVLYLTVTGAQNVSGLTFTAMITYGNSVQLTSAALAAN